MWKNWRLNCEFNDGPLQPSVYYYYFRYDRALSKNMTVKLQDDLEELRSKEASKYELLLTEFEQIRNVFRSQEHV